MRFARPLLVASSLLLLTTAAQAEVVINEVFRGQDATDFVEIFNNGAQAVDISGWQLFAGTKASAMTLRATVPDGTMLAANAYWLFAANFAENAPNGQKLNGGKLPGASNRSADGVDLRQPDTAEPVDRVLYGATEDNPCVINVDEGWGDNAAELCSIAFTNAKSIGRRPNGVDTNKGSDFVRDTPTPGAVNYVPPVSSSSSGQSSSGQSSSGQSSSGTSTTSSGGSSGTSGTTSSGGSSGTSGAASSGGEGGSSSGGKSSSSGKSGGKKTSDGDDDDDNSDLASDGGGCSTSSTSAITPLPYALGLAALLIARRRNKKR